MNDPNNVLDRDDRVSDKNYVTAVILSAIFGVLGIQHFYCERYGLGIFDLALSLTAFTLFMWGYELFGGILFLIDMVHTVYITYLLLTGQFKDGEGRLITYPGQKI
jgi:hypothetical protein